MRRTSLLLLVVAASLATLPVLTRAGQATPILVELFTSEGCSDCPPADVVLERLTTTQPVAGAEIIGLGQHVDYWDQQGWKDRFSSAALTNRQQLYGTRFNLDSVYTPQLVIDGRAQLVGSDAAAARRGIDRALASPHGVLELQVEPAADRSPDKPAVQVSVRATGLPHAGRGDRADIIVAITEDHLKSDVTRGENHGRVLTHTAVVRTLTTIGQVSSEGAASARADVPLGADWQRDQLKVVAFVQELRGRAILASAVVPLQNAHR